MKHNLELLKADVLDELAKIEKLANDFRGIEGKLRLSGDEIPYYDRAAIGYYLHSFYNGCENVFRSVARFFENDPGPRTWHSDLLKRMKLEIPGYRSAMIDDGLYRLLDEFRAFRHIFRHSYTFDLDWERERRVAMKFQTGAEMFQHQVEGFLENLEQIDP